VAAAAVTVPVGGDERGTRGECGMWMPGCGCSGNRARTS
jgi:hypothetical protein